MFHLKILTVGKIKEKWLSSALQEYIKRLQPSMKIDFLLFKNESELEERLLQEKFYVLFDCKGKLLTSEAFSQKIINLCCENKGHLIIGIGGSDGFINVTVKERSKFIFSLSTLTFTHQIVRLIVLEQLYRAVEIEKGSPYHK